MTITLNADYDVTLNTALLGYVGETNARPVSVEGLTVDGADRYVLTIDYGDGTVYEVDITGGQWTPTADIMCSAQTVSCQICAKKLSGQEYILLKKSRIFRLRIGAAIGNNAVPPPSVAADALDKIDAIGRQAHADMQTAVTAADTATTAAENAEKSATTAGVSADTAEQAASRAETAQASAETSATQAETAMQGAETARAEAVTSQNNAKISAAQASVSAQQTTADKNITAGYAKTAKTCADSTTADKQAVQKLAAQVTADKATVADHAAQVTTDRKAAETAAQTAQSIADSLPEDYVTAVGKIAENTADIGRVKLTDKELQRRVNALYDMGNGVTHQFETDSDTSYAKTVPTGAKLMSVKNIGGRSIVFNQMANVADIVDETFDFYYSEVLFSGNRPKWTKGHKYLFEFYVKSNIEPFTTSIGYSNKESVAYNLDGESFSNVVTGRKLLLFTPDDSLIDKGYQYIGVRPVRYDTQKRCTISVKNLMIFDLTAMFGSGTAMFGSGNEPTSVEEFEAMFPADYYPYNAGEIVSAGTESVVEQGANLYYGTDMLKCGSDDYEYIANNYRCKSIKLKPNTTYTLGFTSGKTSETIILMNVNANVNAQPYLDFRKTSDNRSYRTGDDGCLYVGVYAGNGAVASADVVKRLSECEIMISEGDTPTAYAPYHSNVYQIPEAIRNLPGYGWSAGTARNYVDYENKKYVQCVNSVDLGTKNWRMYKDGDYTPFFYLNAVSDIRGGTSNFLCPKYQYVKIGVTDSTSGLYVLENTTVRVRDTAYTDVTTFKRAMQGVILYYELEKPIVTDISTLIPDIFLRNIEVEAGGSVTFKSGNDDYRIPVPNEKEYIVKLSEVGGTT